jgi:hypothetical protein
MRDNLKDFVNANREAFDQREPSADLWNKIRPQVVPTVQERKIKPLWKWASIAAAALVVGTATFIAFDQQHELVVEKPVAAAHPVTVQKSDGDTNAGHTGVMDIVSDSQKNSAQVNAIAGIEGKGKQLAK